MAAGRIPYRCFFAVLMLLMLSGPAFPVRAADQTDKSSETLSLSGRMDFSVDGIMKPEPSQKALEEKSGEPASNLTPVIPVEGEVPSDSGLRKALNGPRYVEIEARDFSISRPEKPVQAGPLRKVTYREQGAFWQARKGESLKNVLDRWSERAGVRFAWSVQEEIPVPVPYDFGYDGPFNAAVAALLDAYEEASGRRLFANAQKKAESMPAVPPPQVEKTPISGKAARDDDPYGTWEAKRGSNLRDVLEDWTDRTNYYLVWNSLEEYRVPKAIRHEGTFTQAVLRILQDAGDHPSIRKDRRGRPTGKIYRDRDTGRRVLVIRSVAE